MLSMFHRLRQPDILAVTLAAAGILMITMGTRQSLGLFIAPLHASTGLGIATISFALAIGQFAWGAVQPLAGACADRYGPRAVLLAGVWLLAAGSALTPFMSSGVGLIVTLGLLSAVGSGAGSFSVLIGAAAHRLPAEARPAASGVINAGGSFGQFIFAPALQKLIQGVGWMGAMWAMALVTLAALPLIGRLVRAGGDAGTAHPAAAPLPNAPTAAAGASPAAPSAATSATQSIEPPAATPDGGMRRAVVAALRDHSYWLLHAGFFTCGFHIAFLVTHLPGEVALCGLPADVASWSLAIIGLANICGSLFVGACVARYRSKLILAAMYGSRALLIAVYLLAPPSAWTFYLFAAGLGFTWLATVPPTAALVGKLFGIRYLATLFGLTLLSHQIGGFLGAWLGGVAISRHGDFAWMWYADMALAALAAVLNLPIREARMRQAATAPTPA